MNVRLSFIAAKFRSFLLWISIDSAMWRAIVFWLDLRDSPILDVILSNTARWVSVSHVGAAAAGAGFILYCVDVAVGSGFGVVGSILGGSACLSGELAGVLFTFDSAKFTACCMMVGFHFRKTGFFILYTSAILWIMSGTSLVRMVILSIEVSRLSMVLLRTFLRKDVVIISRISLEFTPPRGFIVSMASIIDLS